MLEPRHQRMDRFVYDLRRELQIPRTYRLSFKIRKNGKLSNMMGDSAMTCLYRMAEENHAKGGVSLVVYCVDHVGQT